MFETASFFTNQKKIENANRLCYDYHKNWLDVFLWQARKPPAGLITIAVRFEPETCEDMQICK